MLPISLSIKSTILSLLSEGTSYAKTTKATGVSKAYIYKLCPQHFPTLSHAPGGCPSELTPVNTRYTLYLITSNKAETALAVSKNINRVGGVSVSAETVRKALKRGGMKAVV